jgi:hypothetical protein
MKSIVLLAFLLASPLAHRPVFDSGDRIRAENPIPDEKRNQWGMVQHRHLLAQCGLVENPSDADAVSIRVLKKNLF